MKQWMNTMINLEYICFLRRTDNFQLFTLKELSIKYSGQNSDYLQVINRFRLNFKRDPSQLPDEEVINEIEDEDQRIYLLNQINIDSTSSSKQTKQKSKKFAKYEDMENLLCAVPQIMKFTQNGITQFFYFIIGKYTVLICISDEFDPTLRQELILLSRAFESHFGEQTISEANSILSSDEMLYSFINHFSGKILNRYYIPYIPQFQTVKKIHLPVNKVSENKSIIEEIKPLVETLNKTRKPHPLINEKFSTEIDGISDIETIADRINIDSLDLAQILLLLWLKNYLIFRVPIYGWNVFERTHKSNEYLLDGSESQMELLHLYNGGKIISLLSRFDGRSTVAEIQKKMNINHLRFMRYIYDLVDMDLIEISEKFPVLRHIGQEIVPLLVIQGLQQKDLKIIEELESQFDGSKSITSVALKMDQSPEKIKQILDKIPDYVQYNTI
jgi:hypothetical protein